MKKIVLLVVCVLLPAALNAAEKSVSLATLTDFAPYCFRKDNAVQLLQERIAPGEDSVQLQGYSWDVVRRSFHEAGYTIDLYVVPWARVIHYLESGKVDAVFPANRTEKREKIFDFSKGYVDSTRMVAYVPAGKELQWRGLDSLNGMRVGAVRGWAYGKKWEGNQEIHKESVDTILQSFQIMDKGRLDAVVGYEIVYDYILEQERIEHKYKKAGYFGIVNEFLMINKGDMEAKEKMDDFDRGRTILEKNGVIHEIIESWQ
ncbi:MAG: transporter substrate-binding domain-containing protein [Desulfopila sp.]|jgi:polar amino acid transport system substrate-binding protein|nr:transporter substrate-binding domain-containing protein [Desulfopila sp.]